MAALFSPRAPSVPADVKEAQERAEVRAEAQERDEAARMASRRRARRTGGLRLLMSPERQEGPQAGTRTTLGPGG